MSNQLKHEPAGVLAGHRTYVSATRYRILACEAGFQPVVGHPGVKAYHVDGAFVHRDMALSSGWPLNLANLMGECRRPRAAAILEASPPEARPFEPRKLGEF